jgi:hypothetical protein
VALGGLELEDLEHERKRIRLAGLREAGDELGGHGRELEVGEQRREPLGLGRGERDQRHAAPPASS